MKLRIDLRDVPIEDLPSLASGFPTNAGFMATAWQWTAWSKLGGRPAPDRMVIVVPDFLYYARLASTGQARQIIELPQSLSRLIRTAFACVPTGFRNVRGLATGDFWSAAEALLAFDLGLLGGFKGEVMLHYNLSDFVWLFERQDFLRRFRTLTDRKMAAGIATQQVAMGLSACCRWNISPSRMMFTVPANRAEETMIELARIRWFTGTKWTIDMTQWPADLLVQHRDADFARAYDNEWLVTVEASRRLQ